MDNSTFTFIGSNSTSTSLSLSTALGGVSALQDVTSSTTITFRYFASGQTSTGGWGFNSPSASSADDGLVLSGSVPTAASGNGTLGISGAGNTTFSGAVVVHNTATLTAGFDGLASFNGTISGNGSVTKTGAGVVALNTANTLTGNASVSAGTLRLGAANALGNVTSVTVNSTATLEIATSGTVHDSAAVTLNGGTIARAAGVSETFGALTLGANSTIDFGSGATGTVAFQPGTSGGFNPGSFTLSVLNFSQGNVLSFGSSTQLFAVGTYVNGFSGSGFNFGTLAFTASFASNTFTITAIPEPTVILPILAFIGLFLWGERKRLPNQIRKRLRKLGWAKS